MIEEPILLEERELSGTSRKDELEFESILNCCINFKDFQVCV